MAGNQSTSLPICPEILGDADTRRDSSRQIEAPAVVCTASARLCRGRCGGSVEDCSGTTGRCSCSLASSKWTLRGCGTPVFPRKNRGCIELLFCGIALDRASDSDACPISEVDGQQRGCSHGKFDCYRTRGEQIRRCEGACGALAGRLAETPPESLFGSWNRRIYRPDQLPRSTLCRSPCREEGSRGACTGSRPTGEASFHRPDGNW